MAPADWMITVGCESVGAAVHYSADVRRSGAQVCRLSIIGAASEEEARSRLALKARLWIDEFLSRHRSEDMSGGGPLP
ncbi:hypothetical protein J2W36_004651 [Variovorax ginsengisoli]|uniref:CinA C-terminal domain-containing protein n=1 Tax=Variovorax ginsengisoli TaxID=363844 RepID=A0ABT9SEQ6_9BURK|nr:hypothetical protein [Variovorax ginsengisoli]